MADIDGLQRAENAVVFWSKESCGEVVREYLKLERRLEWAALLGKDYLTSDSSCLSPGPSQPETWVCPRMLV